MARCDYANARVRGLHARLLGSHGLRAFASAGPKERDALLSTAGYRHGGEVDAAEWSRFHDFFESEAPRKLWRAFLAFEDAAAIKTVLRGLAAGERPETIASLALPTPSIPQDALRELAAEGTVEGAIARLAARPTTLGLALASALPDFRKHPVMLRLEVPLDRAVFAEALAAAKGHSEDGRILRGLVRARADLTNVATLLKLAGAPELFIEGGALLAREQFARLAGLRALALHEALAVWGERYFGKNAGAELAAPWRADRLLERALQRAMRRWARTCPLSIAVPIAFVLDRRSEARRVRLLLRAEEFGLPLEDLPELAEA
jgi:vacuolar-type H+-ATPase subunit C/Vma6